MSFTASDASAVEQHRVTRQERFGGRARSFVLARGRVGWVVLGGRMLLVWLPVYALIASEVRPLPAVAAASAVSGAWLLALRAAFSTYFTLGPAVGAAVGTVSGLVALSVLDAWAPGVAFSGSGLAETAVAVLILSATWEHAARTVVKRRVLVIGTCGSSSAVMDELEGNHASQFTIVGVVNDPTEAGAQHGIVPFAELSRILNDHRPDIIVLADDRVAAWALEPLLDLAPMGFRVVGVSHFVEHALGRVPLRHLSPTWFMSIVHLRQKPYTRVTKRTFDVVVALLALLLVAPLLPLLAGLVRMTRGPIIYCQTRIGEGGMRYTMYKFRTMRVDAEASGGPIFAQDNDPRATRIGHLLRRTHLDEVPQLCNVLKGEMSIVGPRPERPEFVETLEQTVPFWTRRLLVKPGITGWAQLRSGYADDAESTANKLSYDLWYLRNRDVIVDLAICAKTVSTLLFRPGR